MALTGGAPPRDLRSPHFIAARAAGTAAARAAARRARHRLPRLRPPAARTELIVIAAAAYAGLVACHLAGGTRPAADHPDAATLIGWTCWSSARSPAAATRCGRRNGARPAGDALGWGVGVTGLLLS